MKKIIMIAAATLLIAVNAQCETITIVADEFCPYNCEPDSVEPGFMIEAASEILTALPADRWAAVTSGSGSLMRARLGAAGLPLPRVLVAAEDVSAGKPDPQGYRRAAEGLGVAVTRCLVVEDAPAGLAAGHAAGASVLAVATSHPVDDLRAAHAVVADLRSLRVEVSADGLSVAVPG